MLPCLLKLKGGKRRRQYSMYPLHNLPQFFEYWYQRISRIERCNAFQEKKVSLRDEEIIRLHLSGLNNRQIAKELKTAASTVSICLNAEPAKRRIDAFNTERMDVVKDFRARIDRLTDLSLSVFEQILNGEDGLNISDSEKLDLARHILVEFSGLRAPTQIQTQSVVMTADRLEEIKRRGAKLLEEMRGVTVKVESTTIN